MNREIKFKGKRADGSSWAYGDLRQENSGNKVIMTNLSTWGDNDNVDCWGENIIVNPNTLGQYTGLRDKNNEEIYEHDIVKAPLLDPIFRDIIKDAFCNAEIRFNKGSFVVSYYGGEHNIYLSDLYDKIEVIGNVFDNPELIRKNG